MPTQKEISESIDVRLAAIQAEQAALKQTLLDAMTHSQSKEFVLLKDSAGREVMIYPNLVIGLSQSRVQGPVPNSYFETTIVKQAFLDDDGKTVETHEFYGMPFQVAELIGLRWHRQDQVPPVAKIIASNAAEANAAIAALGAALAHEIDITGRTSVVNLTAPAANMVLVIKGWKQHKPERERWQLSAEGNTVKAVCTHSGFTVLGAGFVGIKLDGDAEYVKVPSPAAA